MHIASITVALFLAFFSICACAADVEDLYSARVAVADRSDAEFKRGLSKALAAVIVKLTGSSASARTKSGRAVVGRAQRMVQQFGYEKPRSNRAGSALMLRVEFDARVLTNEMRARNLVVWGKERPDTLVWLVLEDESGPRLLGAHDPHPLINAIKARAHARGVPVILPLGDIAESSAISGLSDVKSIADALGELGQKYDVRSSLVGHLQQAAPGLWESDWLLRVGTEVMNWQNAGDIVELIGEEASESLADALGRRFASPAVHTVADAVAITVRNLHSASDYARTERYLSTLDSVRKLLVRRVDDSGIVFDLNVQGGMVALRQSISFGTVLRADPRDPNIFVLNPR